MMKYSDGATPLDYDDLEGLLLTHITTRGELDRWEMENIHQAMLWTEGLKKKDILNIDFICRMNLPQDFITGLFSFIHLQMETEGTQGL